MGGSEGVGGSEMGEIGGRANLEGKKNRVTSATVFHLYFCVFVCPP